MDFKRRSGYKDGGSNWKLCTILLFIVAYSGSESADTIFETLSNNLQTSNGYDLAVLNDKFTYENDCAAVMAKEFGASVLSKKVSFRARWMSCISHQINTKIKNVINSEPINSSKVSKNLISLKSLVAKAKRTDFNPEPPNGFSFIREVSICFGSSFGFSTSSHFRSASWGTHLIQHWRRRREDTRKPDRFYNIMWIWRTPNQPFSASYRWCILRPLSCLDGPWLFIIADTDEGHTYIGRVEKQTGGWSVRYDWF